jgi:hypothetical protein
MLNQYRVQDVIDYSGLGSSTTCFLGEPARSCSTTHVSRIAYASSLARPIRSPRWFCTGFRLAGGRRFNAVSPAMPNLSLSNDDGPYRALRAGGCSLIPIPRVAPRWLTGSAQDAVIDLDFGRVCALRLRHRQRASELHAPGGRILTRLSARGRPLRPDQLAVIRRSCTSADIPTVEARGSPDQCAA